MNKAGRIISLNPPNAIPGAEIIVECDGFVVGKQRDYSCQIGGKLAKVIGASGRRVMVIVPEFQEPCPDVVEVVLESGGDTSEPVGLNIGRELANNLHLVANPAIDPKDDSIILTRSGSRGQQLPVTLFRLEPDGFLREMPTDIMNPTGIAFDPKGKLFVTNRADGEVCQVNDDDEAIIVASSLGTATGLAFDPHGEMFVGDRNGSIYRVPGFGDAKLFASLDPSVSAYHLAFDNKGYLYAAAPGLSSFDSIYTFDEDGIETQFYRGLGRPQGMAFDRENNLYIAACLRGKRGIVKISDDGAKAELFVAGMNVVGLCFSNEGEMIVATNDTVYSLMLGIYGILV